MNNIRRKILVTGLLATASVALPLNVLGSLKGEKLPSTNTLYDFEIVLQKFKQIGIMKPSIWVQKQIEAGNINKNKIKEHIEKEFLDGDIVEVHGLIMSFTEFVMIGAVAERVLLRYYN